MADFAEVYLQPLFALLVFQVIEAAGIACLVGAGDTVTGLWVRAGVAVFNVPLAWGFFHGFGPVPALGFVGIALGTAVSNVLGATAVLAVLLRGRAGLQLRMGGCFGRTRGCSAACCASACRPASIVCRWPSASCGF